MVRKASISQKMTREVAVGGNTNHKKKKKESSLHGGRGGNNQRRGRFKTQFRRKGMPMVMKELKTRTKKREGGPYLRNRKKPQGRGTEKADSFGHRKSFRGRKNGDGAGHRPKRSCLNGQ